MKKMNLIFDDADFEKLQAKREYIETSTGKDISSWEKFIMALCNQHD